jgi:hypothetical protein
MPRPSIDYVSLRVVRFYVLGHETIIVLKVQLSKFSDFAISMREHKDFS